MRIIKVGRAPEERLYKGTCKNCGTVFECLRHEGKPLTMGIAVNCPVCGSGSFAYERNDGALIPQNDRNYWDGGLHNSLAAQYADPPNFMDR